MQVFQVSVATCLLVCLLAASAERIVQERVDNSIKECKEEMKEDLPAVSNVIKGSNETENDMTCFGFCVMKKLKLLDEDGTFQKDVALENVPEGTSHDEFAKNLDICAAEKGDDVCSTVGLLITCLRKLVNA